MTTAAFLILVAKYTGLWAVLMYVIYLFVRGASDGG